MRRFLPLLLLLFILSLSGCYENIVRYQLVPIPDYRQADYEALLNSEDEEIKYNAICNLIGYASGYADILNSAEKAEAPLSSEKLSEYKRAKQVYHSVCSALHSRDENIKAASLIFLSEFGMRYKNKDELNNLINLISTLDVKDKRTQYEQLYALISVISKNHHFEFPRITSVDTKVNSDLIKKYLNSKSWLIRSTVYFLLSITKSADYHERLIQAYRDSTQEYDKLLILSVFVGSKNYGPDVFAFIKTELKREESVKVKKYLAAALTRFDDTEAVAEWVLTNHQNLEDDISDTIIEVYSYELENDKGIIFFKTLLGSGDDQLKNSLNNESVFSHLYAALAAKKNDTDLGLIEKMILDTESLGAAYNKYKTNKAREEFVKQETDRIEKSTEKKYVPKYLELYETILQDMIASLEKNGLNEEEIEAFTKKYKKQITEIINHKLLKKEEKEPH